MKKIFIARSFESDFKKVPIDIKFKTEFAIGKLKRNPFSPDFKIKKLKGLGKNFWRIKVDQNYRLIYSISKNSVILHYIGHRKDIYQGF